MSTVTEFIRALPKAELHVHLEGTLAPDLKFKLAERNGIALPFANIDEIRRSYVYHDLPSFLTIFYDGFRLLITEQDFEDLCFAYLTKAAAQNVLHAEMFFDPQPHLARGIELATVVTGFSRARARGRQELGISSQLIMCFNRELSAHSAMNVLEQAIDFSDQIVGIGLDSDEKDNPPAKFGEVFKRARAAGFRLTMHCDVDQRNTHAHIRQALVDVGVDRIDHGLNIVQDPSLMAIALERDIAFTVCPFANDVVRPGAGQVALREMIDRGLKVTLNSDDPAYMQDCYIAENFAIAQAGAALEDTDLIRISHNAFEAAWMEEEDRSRCISALQQYAITGHSAD